MKDYTNYKTSRVSGGESTPFFSANLPLAGEFLTKDQIGQDQTYPLTLSFCPLSSSVQVNEVINAKKLFSNYFYKTGSIKTLVDHFEKTSAKLKKRRSISKVLELGCNDFSFLKNFVGDTELIVGVDPSDVSLNNIPNGCVLENDFFDFSKSELLKEKYGEFNLVFSSNNLAHIEDIQDYVKGIRNLIGENGFFVGEVHWVGTLIEKLQFPFIYHEHMYYHSLKALCFLFEQNGMSIYDVEEIDIHGGSIRFYAVADNVRSSVVSNFLAREEKLGLHLLETYQDFALKIQNLKEKSKDFFDKARKDGKTIYGYGASGQANTLMSVFEIAKEDMPIIIDDSPLKQGLYTPQNHIQIEDRKFLIDNPPDYIYLLAYTFLKEIQEKNKGIDAKWILPI